MTMKRTDSANLSELQLDLIEHFVADYNAVDHFLRKALNCDDHVPFVRMVREYSEKNAAWRDADLLKTIAKVRNVVVHNKTEPFGYAALPSHQLAQKLKACLNSLISPPLVVPTFGRGVETISVGDNLAKVLKVIKQRDYSQFPVYETEQFRGLLTENGITRWLAKHVSTTISLIKLDGVSVKEVLDNEEERTNYHFVAQDTSVDEVIGQFASHEMLEAVLITATGQKSEALLGIVTRWDVVHRHRDD